ncbi:MAG: hypothetical protein ABIQ93_08985, partial [Saprospiraceae bacterium]
LLFGSVIGYAQGKLPADSWRQDIDSLQRQLPALHPNFFATYPRQAFEQALTKLKTQLSGKTDFQIALELQTIVAKAGDAQTRLDFTEMMMHEKVIPFALSVWAGELYVSATIQRFEKISGAKILKINGLTTTEALAKMGRFVAQENEYTTLRDALTYFRFPMALQLAGVSTTDTLALLVEKRPGQQELVKIYALDPAKPPNRSDSGPVVVQPQKPDLRWQQASSFFTQQWLPKDSVLYVQYNHCLSREMSLAIGDSLSAAQFPPFQIFTDSMFAFIARTPYAKVLIDLRFNSGGDPADGLAWAKRLAALPKSQRPAQLFVATNLFTQGAATEVAATFASLGAKLIGEPSGTRPNHYDSVRQFFLPNSHVAVQFGMRYRQVQKGKSTVLAPKVLIPVTFDQYRSGHDPVLDYVRKAR